MAERLASGIHHVTVVSGDAQANRDFWAGVLGLRPVKKTVNFDDPETYHLYYGDAAGSPGTILTFFPYGRIRTGRVGTGQATAVALAVPTDSLDFWRSRLADAAVEVSASTRLGEKVLAFADPDGLPVELVATAGCPAGWPGVVGVHAPAGAHSVTLTVTRPDKTAAVLELLGFRRAAESDGRVRFEAGGAIGRYVDVVAARDDAPGGTGGAGTIHHVAFRVGGDGGEGGDEAEVALRARVAAAGLSPTPVIDRQYFHSVYFREPSGVLFELATDPPGFAIDEDPSVLGEALRLPPQYEGNRSRIEEGLRPLAPPSAGPTFVHNWLPRDGSARTLVALHGTGGDENDLVPLAKSLDTSSNVLSPRGRVSENGMPRFFRRHAEGVFDEESVVREAGALADFVAAQADRYGFDASRLAAVGYSNGANIAAAVVLLRGGVFRELVLLRPMVPLDARLPASLPDASGVRVLILNGLRDPIAPPPHAQALAALLRRAGADVTMTSQDAGHELTQPDVDAAAAFLRG